MNYFEIDRLSFSKLKAFNTAYRYGILDKWEYKSTESTPAMERGTIIHRMMDDSDDIDIQYIELPSLNTGKEPTILTQILENIDNEVNMEALVERIYNDNYAKPKKDDYLPFFEKIKDYLTTILESRINENKYIIDNEKLYWECVNSAKSLNEAERDLINADVLSGRTVIRELPELEIMWEYEGVECKSKLDKVYLVDNGNSIEPIIIDYKIISQSIDATLKKFNYIGQMAFYRLALESWLAEHYKGFNLEVVQCHLLMINPEYGNTRIVTLSYEDWFKSKWGGFINDRQTIVDYYGSKTLSCYYLSDNVESHYESIGIIDVIASNNANYYVGIDKLVEEYGKYRANLRLLH